MGKKDARDHSKADIERHRKQIGEFCDIVRDYDFCTKSF